MTKIIKMIKINKIDKTNILVKIFQDSSYAKLSVKRGGFTLIEIMVSITLFTIVMMLSLGAIFSIIDGNKKAQAINSVANNLNFAIESMVRDIKTGYAYTCGGGIPAVDVAADILDGGNGCDASESQESISLVSTITGSNNGSKRGVKYERIEDSSGRGSIIKTVKDEVGVENPYPLTSPEVDVQKLDFYVDNPVSSSYSGQPKVFLIIKGTTTVSPDKVTDFTIQTLISQRNLNLPTQ